MYSIQGNIHLTFLLPFHLCFQQVNLDKANSNVSQISFLTQMCLGFKTGQNNLKAQEFFFSCFMHINITFGYDNGRSRNTNCP